MPGSTVEAAAVMRVAAEHELAVVVRGGGSRLDWGVPASRCDVVVDTSRMSGVLEHAAGDLVARLQAGKKLWRGLRRVEGRHPYGQHPSHDYDAEHVVVGLSVPAVSQIRATPLLNSPVLNTCGLRPGL